MYLQWHISHEQAIFTKRGREIILESNANTDETKTSGNNSLPTASTPSDTYGISSHSLKRMADLKQLRNKIEEEKYEIKRRKLEMLEVPNCLFQFAEGKCDHAADTNKQVFHYIF